MENVGLAARRAGIGAPYRVNADSPYGLLRALCCCAERRGLRSLPHVREFAGGLLKTGMLLRGAPGRRALHEAHNAIQGFQTESHISAFPS